MIIISKRYDKIIKLSQSIGSKILLNEPMKAHTSFKIGGPADVFAEINTLENLKQFLKVLNEENLPYFLIGNGSNLLVADEGYKGVVIRLVGEFVNVTIEKKEKISILKCGAGAFLAKACAVALKNSLTGLEFAWGIPGTVGGAAYMNAGAYEGEMKNVVVSIQHIDNLGNTYKLNKEQLDFSYRKSFYSGKNNIITSVTIELKYGNKREIKDKMNKLIMQRKSKQPLEMPSAGSVFKRPKGHFVGPLIEQCGLKGAKIGGAQISEKHAGFIVNAGNATCEDVLNLINLIKQKIYDFAGIDLICEVKTLNS